MSRALEFAIGQRRVRRPMRTYEKQVMEDCVRVGLVRECILYQYRFDLSR